MDGTRVSQAHESIAWIAYSLRWVEGKSNHQVRGGISYPLLENQDPSLPYHIPFVDHIEDQSEVRLWRLPRDHLQREAFYDWLGFRWTILRSASGFGARHPKNAPNCVM